MTAGLNHESIGKNPYDWKEKKFPSEAKDWEKFETSNKSVAVNVRSHQAISKKILQEMLSKD